MSKIVWEDQKPSDWLYRKNRWTASWPANYKRKVDNAALDLLKKGVELLRLTDGGPLLKKPPPKDLRPPYPPEECLEEFNGEITKFYRYEKEFPTYGGAQGLLELREVIADKLEKDNGIAADPKSEIIITIGTTHAFNILFHAFLEPGDEVITEQPSYRYFGFIALADGVPRFMPLKEENKWKPDLEKLEDIISPRTKMILINSPHNPTGKISSKDDLEGIADIAKKHDLIVVSDEVFEKIIFDDEKHYSIGSLPGMKDRTITLNSTSKYYGMDHTIRIGYVTANKTIIERLRVLNRWYMIAPSVIDQKLAKVVIRYDTEKQYTKEIAKSVERSRDIFLKGLGGIPRFTYVKPKGFGGMFPNVKALMHPFTKLKTSEDFAEYLVREANVYTDPGPVCNLEGHLRVTYSDNPEIPKRIKEAVEKLL